MTDVEIVRGDGVTLVPVPPGVGLDALETLTGGRAVGRGWPHDGTSAALSFGAAGGWTWLIVDADGCVVGECGTKHPPIDGCVEIGYGLAGPSRGRGLGGRAVTALVRWLAAVPDIREMTAMVVPDNVASRRLLERLGFTVTGSEGAEIGYRLLLGEQPR